MRSPRVREIADMLGQSSRPTRVTAALGAVLAAALVIAIIVGVGLPGSSQGASPAAKVSGAATVQRRDLVATDTESGTLNYANPQTVFNRMSGTITWLPQVGQLIKPGQAFYDVDNQPVTLFNGTTPAYRDLSASDSNGPDIQELNQDLVNMGFDPSHEITVNDTWQTGTTNAVDAWQASLGETQTGTITLGQVVFLPGTQRITTINAVLGSTGGSTGTGTGTGSGTGSGATGASTLLTPHAEFVSLTTTRVLQATASAANTDAKASAAASAASVKAQWANACAAHDLGLLRNLKREHPSVLSALVPATCEQKATPTTGGKTTSTTVQKRPTATDATTRDVSSVLSTELPAATGNSYATRPMSATGSPPANSGVSKGGSGRGSPGGGLSGTSSNAAILRALQALLKAETLLLQRSTGSSGRATGGGASGASTASLSGASGGGSARGSGASAGSGAGAASTGGSGSGASASTGAGTGSGSASAQAILGTTSNQVNVVVNLDATKQSEAVLGEPVTVQMPDGSVVDGKIAQVSPVAQSSSSSGSGSGSGSGSSTTGSSSSSSATSTIPVTITIRGRIPSSGLDQAAVSVNFEQQVANNVLSVPVTALLATAGGGYAVQESAAPRQLIPVTPGLFAAGYVQISGSQIYPGLQVTDSQG